MEKFVHLTAPEMGEGLIAVVVLAAALPVIISALILLMIIWRMARARLARMRTRHMAPQSQHRFRAEALVSQRAG